jgi:hypothetical protein
LTSSHHQPSHAACVDSCPWLLWCEAFYQHVINRNTVGKINSSTGTVDWKERHEKCLNRWNN